MRRDYCANGGWETFLAYEDVRQDILVGLLRLRRCFGAGAGPAAERQPGLRGRVRAVYRLQLLRVIMPAESSMQKVSVGPRGCHG